MSCWARQVGGFWSVAHPRRSDCVLIGGVVDGGDGAEELESAQESHRELDERSIGVAALDGGRDLVPEHVERSSRESAAEVERTDAGSRLSFETVVGADVLVPVAREDLLEVLGALLENASRYARRRVRVSGEPGASPRLVIEDDGPGIPDEFLADVLVRGRRLDERGPGFGLGLSIVQELAQATGATIALSRSVLGGLRVEIQWSPRAVRPT